LRPETKTRGERRRRKESRVRAKRVECLPLPDGQGRSWTRSVSSVEVRKAEVVDRRAVTTFWSTPDGLYESWRLTRANESR